MKKITTDYPVRVFFHIIVFTTASCSDDDVALVRRGLPASSLVDREQRRFRGRDDRVTGVILKILRLEKRAVSHVNFYRLYINDGLSRTEKSSRFLDGDEQKNGSENKKNDRNNERRRAAAVLAWPFYPAICILGHPLKRLRLPFCDSHKSTDVVGRTDRAALARFVSESNAPVTLCHSDTWRTAVTTARR